MSSLIELVQKDPSRVKVYKKVNNPNYNSEYYHNNKDKCITYQHVNKLKCNVCDVILTLASKKTHIYSSKHKLKLLETGTELENPEDCFIKIKIDLDKPE